ncbi:ADP-ribosylation factor-like protein 2 isoform X1 [Acinonyx jubatus]|uniref:ADP-ribosylation factor-like protein 2 n=1 Tax=Acinonyx jubatus TaxID=32536 RepID=A0ABM3NHM8_ACIJB|nr:ADP-ribosylation factor-like protein 2 isoform X1 [Acinonyx jubatus]
MKTEGTEEPFGFWPFLSMRSVERKHDLRHVLNSFDTWRETIGPLKEGHGGDVTTLGRARGLLLNLVCPRGLDNAGKTTILKKFNGEDIDTISPTLGFNIKTLEHRGFKLNIWDVGGQKSLRSYWRNYFESTDGLIWVVDSADRQRMKDCQRELQSLLVEERLAGATLLIFANKQDLPGALSSNAICEALELDSIHSHHWCIQGCSAVTGENLLPGIDWLLDDISSRVFTAD